LSTRIGTAEDAALARAQARLFAQGLDLSVVEQIRIASPVGLLAALLIDEGLTGSITLSTEVDAEGTHAVVTLSDVQSADGHADLPSISLEISSALGAAAGMHMAIVGENLVFRRPVPTPSNEVSPSSLHSNAPVASLVQQQRVDLLVLLEELSWREGQLADLNREIEETNRGVLALYEELEDRAEGLRRLNELQRRLMSHLTHEFRTPLAAIQSLGDMLLGGLDGELTPEQERQVSFIRRAAIDLTALVDDLLDLAKAREDRQQVTITSFDVPHLFGALRGLMRPLAGPDVLLSVETPSVTLTLTQDEAKISQILRNLVSNALKFTEQGEVRVWAEPAENDGVAFHVADTGVGIAIDDLERIFEDFTQIDVPLWTKVKGTGLGLPLSRRLVELLGGTLSVESTLGRGSVFTAAIPRVLVPEGEGHA